MKILSLLLIILLITTAWSSSAASEEQTTPVAPSTTTDCTVNDSTALTSDCKCAASADVNECKEGKFCVTGKICQEKAKATNADKSSKSSETSKASWCEDNDPKRIQIKCAGVKNKADCNKNEVDPKYTRCEWISTLTHGEVCSGSSDAFEATIYVTIIVGYLFLLIFLIVDYSRRKLTVTKNVEYYTRQVNYLRGSPEIVKGAGFWENRNWYMCNEYLPFKMVYGDFAHYVSKFEGALIFVFCFSFSLFMTATLQVAKERFNETAGSDAKFFAITLPNIIANTIFFMAAKWDENAGLKYGCCYKKMARFAGRLFSCVVLSLSIIFSVMAYFPMKTVLNPKCFFFNVILYGQVFTLSIGYLKQNLKFWVAYKIYVEKALDENNTKDSAWIKFVLKILQYPLLISKPGEIKVCDRMKEKGVEDAGGEKSLEPVDSLSVGGIEIVESEPVKKESV